MPELHEYQKQAAAWLRGLDRTALFLDMGLGKTATTLSALEPRHLPALVVAPKRVAENVWGEERDIWRPDLTMSLAVGTKDKRAAALRTDADITVIGRDNIRDVLPVARRFQTLILDELSGFKAISSMRWKTARKAAKLIPGLWGLTGTPAPNGLLDLWAQMYLIDFGKRLYPRITDYRERYFIAGRRLPNGIVSSWALRPGAADKIHALLDDIVISMSADDKLDLPPVTYNTVTVPLPANLRAHYAELKREFITDMELLGGGVYSAKNAAVMSGRLSQLLAGFMYHDGDSSQYDVIHQEKLNALQEIVDGTGSPIFVAYRFRAEKEMILKRFAGQAHTIDEPNIIKRWNAGTVPILIAHPQAVGHGLNLQKGPGHTIVWSTLTWSLEEWEQFNGRLARQGQTRPVTVHTLEVPNSVDRAMHRSLLDKADIQDALNEHLESPL